LSASAIPNSVCRPPEVLGSLAGDHDDRVGLGQVLGVVASVLNPERRLNVEHHGL
jgi:hypothetical protein